MLSSVERQDVDGVQSLTVFGLFTPLVALPHVKSKDPSVQLELAQAAQQVGDGATAIAAYEQFLKLAPDDPSAAVVRQQLKQLRGTAAAASG